VRESDPEPVPGLAQKLDPKPDLEFARPVIQFQVPELLPVSPAVGYSQAIG